jgi:hypothetical protein
MTGTATAGFVAAAGVRALRDFGLARGAGSVAKRSDTEIAPAARSGEASFKTSPPNRLQERLIAIISLASTLDKPDQYTGSSSETPNNPANISG